MSTQANAGFIALPTTQSSRLIDFERARVTRRGDQYVLTVSGTAPCANMKVALQPLVYIQQPEYWGIEVIGTLPGGICLPATRKYVRRLNVTSTLGTRGIEVIGATRTERIDVVPAPAAKAKR